MKLKKGVSLSSFLKEVQHCSGEVTFQTREGDCLNLKSVLTTYIFITLMMDPEILDSGWVTCEKDPDYSLLDKYLTP